MSPFDLLDNIGYLHISKFWYLELMHALLISNFLAFLQGIGTTEILIIFFAILLLFGAKKLPELARGMGKSIKEFKKAAHEVEEDIRTSVDAEDLDENKEEKKIEASDGDKS